MLFVWVLAGSANAQHTFSIVAVDTLTGEVGGAGATCYDVVNDIADVHPGVGFIHTQSYVDYTNQAYGKSLMDRGFLPQEIMDSLAAHDITNQPQLRQYAAVSLVAPRTAAYTGSSCYAYKGQRVGATYAIAGNILKGAMVLDSMEAWFNRTEGTLADKLMAALEGAKMIGADKRCNNKGVSSLSAYMIVAKPTDVAPNYYLNLNVEFVHPMEPIDTLRRLYDAWKLSTSLSRPVKEASDIHVLFENPLHNGALTLHSNLSRFHFTLLNTAGNPVISKELSSGEALDVSSVARGMYLVRVEDGQGRAIVKKLIIN